jgi:imidazolonepropionase-like amidohydrolase
MKMNMFRLFWSYAFLLFTLAGLAACNRQPATLIADVNVFDGERVHEKVNFIFNERGIHYIGKRKPRPGRYIVLDGRGKTILPPLINAHVHVAEADNLREALSVGVFALMDMFSTDERALSIRPYKDSLLYARYFSSQVGATPPGGHGTQFGVRIPVICDTLSPARFVRDRIHRGADYIKITQEFTRARLDTAQLSAIADEAHRHGKVCLAHVSRLEDAMEVIGCDVDGLAHIWYRKGSSATERDLKVIKESGVFVIPTLSVIKKLIGYVQENELGVERYLSMDSVLTEVRRLYQKGVPVLAGTDAPNLNMNYSDQFFEEMQLLTEAGLPNEEVLKAATSNIYQSFALEDFGVLEKDAPASFVLLDGNPLLRMEDMKKEKEIWKNGLRIY